MNFLNAWGNRLIARLIHSSAALLLSSLSCYAQNSPAKPLLAERSVTEVNDCIASSSICEGNLHIVSRGRSAEYACAVVRKANIAFDKIVTSETVAFCRLSPFDGTLEYSLAPKATFLKDISREIGINSDIKFYDLAYTPWTYE